VARTRPFRSFLALALVGSALIVPSMPAAGLGVISHAFDAGHLSIGGTSEDDSVIVECESAKVTINWVPIGVRCGRVKTLSVVTRAGQDDIRLSDMKRTDFPNLVEIVVDGGGGPDTIDGSNMRETLKGGRGNDELTGNGGVDTIVGGDGKDQAEFEGANPVVTPTLISADGTKDHISGIEHVDISADWSVDNTIDARAWTGTSSLYGGSGNDTIIGSPQSDEIRGEDGSDTMQGKGGRDMFTFGYGADAIDGGRGKDQVRGNFSGGTVTLTDTSLSSTVGSSTSSLASVERAHLSGNTGAALTIDASGWTRGVQVFGAYGPDTFIGGPGDDVINGHYGSDTIDGGGGYDTLVYTSLSGAGTVTLTDSEAIDAVTGTKSLTSIEAARFSLSSARTINATAFSGPITVNGSPGHDVVQGGAGDDVMNGEGGDDTLTGNLGNDTADGGDGTDTCSAETVVNCEA
jgi:Ca2+-binding RTX toxin-like protein